MAVTFTTAMGTTNYRVILSTDGLYPVYITGKTRTGFVIHVGYTLATAEVRTIGYDVFA
jgi:hypothetical protein